MVAAAAAFAAGQVAGAASLLVLALVSIIALRRGQGAARAGAFAAALGAFVIAGWMRQSTQTVVGPHDVSRWLGSGHVEVTGSVVGEPARSGRSTHFALAAKAAGPPGRPREACTGLLRCRLLGDAADIEIHHADNLSLSGVLESPRSTGNPGAFDSVSYLRRHGIFACLAVRYAPNVKLSAGPDGALAQIPRLALAWRGSLMRHLREHLSMERAAILTGIVLGGRSGLRGETADAFVRSGSAHVLAASGLNVALFVGAILIAAQWLGLSRVTRTALGIPAAAFYAVAAGCEPGAVRAAIMASVYLGAPLLDRLPDPPSALAAAALAALVYDPGALWDAGFQLSFGIVAVALAAMPLWEIADRRVAPPPQVTARRWPVLRWRLARAVLGSVTLSITASVAAAPLTAYWFQSVSLVAPLTNALIAPLVGLLLPATLASWVLSLVWQPLGAAICQWLLDPVLSAMLRVVASLGGLPVAQVSVGAVQPWSVAVAYGSLALVIAAIARRQRSPRR